MYRHRFDNVGGRFPGGYVSLLKPSQAFVDNPSDANDAAQAGALADHIALIDMKTVLGRTMYDADLNAAYSLRRLFTDYRGAHIRVRRSGDNAETDVTFDSKGLVFKPADWASWSVARTLFVPIIYDQSGQGKHAVLTGSCTLNAATKSIMFPAGANYYTIPQFVLPTGSNQYTIYFHHGTLISFSANHLFATSQNNTANNSLSGRIEDLSNTRYRHYWWANDLVTSNVTGIANGSYMAFTWNGTTRSIFRSGVSIASAATSGKNTISRPGGDYIGISGALSDGLNGEFKEMIVVKKGHSPAFIASLNATLTAP